MAAVYEVRGKAHLQAGVSTLVAGAVAVTLGDGAEIEDGVHFLLSPGEARELARALHGAAFAAELVRKKGAAA